MPSVFEVAVGAAWEAGRLLQLRRSNVGLVKAKQDKTDLVSESDFAAERLIVDHIHRHFPDDAIVAEEGSGVGRRSQRTWYVDPLDGTTNFVHGHPFFSVSIACADQGELLCGVVYAPALDELWTAERGHGAWLNGRRISVSNVQDIGDSMLASGFAYDPDDRLANVPFWRAFLGRAQALRRDGSAALDLAYVAGGRFEGYWERPLGGAWDVAAGLLLVRESGGRVSNFAGSDIDFDRPEVVASNGHIHGQLLEVVKQVLAERSLFS